MSNLDLYNKVRSVPSEAKKPISGGRLKGMTDINPMWRIKTLTEQFGACGIGWYIEILEERIEEGASGEKVAFTKINLYVKHNNEWSKPIQGTGGSSFISKERNGLYTSDECFKMALTDAISVSCKSLGIGADVYFEKDRTKYDKLPDNEDNSYYSIRSKYELIVNKNIRDWKEGDFDSWYKNQQEKYKPQQIDTFLTKILRSALALEEQ